MTETTTETGSTEINRITGLLQVTRRLTAVLDEEVAILRAMTPPEARALQEEKHALTTAYEAHIRAADGAVDDMPPALRAELTEATVRFRESLKQNERSLRAARHTSERVLRAIADEVERTRGETAAYGAGGTIAERSPRSGAQPVSLAIDQRL